MSGLDDIMGGVGLFGGGGDGSGALGGYIAAIVKMIYLMAARGSIPFIEANQQLGAIFDSMGRARSVIVAGQQVLSSPMPSTPEGWVDYANRVFTQGEQAVAQGRVLAERVGAHIGPAAGMLGAVEACLAAPDGGIHTDQCAGTASLLGAQADLNGLALESVQTDLLLQERAEKEAGRRLGIEAGRAFLGEEQPLMGADPIDPWKGF